MAGTSDATEDIEFGTPGASARARYERLRRRDDEVRGELTRTLANSFPAYTGGRRASPG